MLLRPGWDARDAPDVACRPAFGARRHMATSLVALWPRPMRPRKEMPVRTVRRILLSALFVGMFALMGAWGFVGASPASAHNTFVSGTPAPDSTVTAVPATFSVETDDAVQKINGAQGFGLDVTDTQGKHYGNGCVTVTEKGVSMGATLGAAGDYKLTWQVISEDGHPVSSSYAFHYAPAQGQQETPGSATPVTCGQQPAAATPATTVPTESASPAPSATAHASEAPKSPSTGEQAAKAFGAILIFIGVIVALVVFAIIIVIVWIVRRRKRAQRDIDVTRPEVVDPEDPAAEDR